MLFIPLHFIQENFSRTFLCEYLLKWFLWKAVALKELDWFTNSKIALCVEASSLISFCFLKLFIIDIAM